MMALIKIMNGKVIKMTPEETCKKREYTERQLAQVRSLKVNQNVVRECLRCVKPFKAENKFIRMCRQCKDTVVDYL